MSAAATPPQSFLMDIPLELRYKVFEAVAARSNPPEHLFVHWFEKKEVAELIRNHVATYPDAPPPIARYSKYKPEPESESEDENEDDDGDSEMDDEDSEQAGEDEDEDEDEDMDGEDDNDVDGEDQVEPDDEDMDDANDEHADEDDIHVLNIGVNAHQASEIQAATASHVGQEDELHPESEIEEPTNQAEASGEEHEHEHEHEGNDDAAMVGDNTTTEAAAAAAAATTATTTTATDATDATNVTADADTDATTDVTAAQPAQPPPPPPRPAVFRAAAKWRHVAKFMKITHYPPPMELLLSSKVLNYEAMDWYYDTAILHIEATSGTMAHTSFFEEALNWIADAAFSPVENIRKVDVTFVWDSAWMHAHEQHDILEAILPALLDQRARFILGILKRAPALKELTIHWHDSLQDNNSTDMKLEILESFLELPASVNVVEHFIEPDAKPYRKSIAGKFRMELQAITDRGLEAFYG